MPYVTSGDVKAKAVAEGIPADRLEGFVRRWHAKKQYLTPEQALQSCLIEEKNIAFGGYPGQVPTRKVGSAQIAGARS